METSHLGPLAALLASVRVHTTDDHEAQVMDVNDVATLQRRVILWMLGVLGGVVVLSATAAIVWTGEHRDQLDLALRIEAIDKHDSALRQESAVSSIHDTLIVLRLAHIADLLNGSAGAQQEILRRITRLERKLNLEVP